VREFIKKSEYASDDKGVVIEHILIDRKLIG